MHAADTRHPKAGSSLALPAVRPQLAIVPWIASTRPVRRRTGRRRPTVQLSAEARAEMAGLWEYRNAAIFEGVAVHRDWFREDPSPAPRTFGVVFGIDLEAVYVRAFDALTDAVIWLERGVVSVVDWIRWVASYRQRRYEEALIALARFRLGLKGRVVIERVPRGEPRQYNPEPQWRGAAGDAVARLRS